ncbi:MAG: HAD-IA family hydrolase, partial [Candidatus Micrarchaeia archaeon]
DPVEDGYLPGTGLTVRGLEFATGVKPVVIGKPKTDMLELILRENGLRKEEVVVVGDNEEMDIKMANDAGVKSVLIGKARNYTPTCNIRSIKELVDVLQKLE